MIFDERFKVFRHRETIRVPSPGGRLKPLRLIASGETKAKCKAEFERKRTEAIREAERGATPAPKGTKSFVDFAREWLATYPASVRNRENTKTSKTYHVNVRLIPYFERLARERAEAGGTNPDRARPFTLAEITPKVVDKLVADLSESFRISRAKDRPGASVAERRARGKVVAPRKLSAKSVANIAMTLKKLFETAERWGDMEKAPEVPNVKVTKPKFDFLTFDEAERLVEALDRGGAGAEEDRALILTAMRTGPRANELLGLQWSNVDFVKREIRYEAQLHRTIRNRLEPVKAGVRTVPMSEALAETLRRLKHMRFAPDPATGYGATGRPHWIFCDADGNHYRLTHLRWVVKRWCRRAGLRIIHPHGLRHTFASHLVMRAVHLKKVQTWLGHASINMTMRYAHLAPDFGNEEIEVLETPAARSEGAEQRKERAK